MRRYIQDGFAIIEYGTRYSHHAELNEIDPIEPPILHITSKIAQSRSSTTETLSAIGIPSGGVPQKGRLPLRTDPLQIVLKDSTNNVGRPPSSIRKSELSSVIPI